MKTGKLIILTFTIFLLSHYSCRAQSHVRSGHEVTNDGYWVYFANKDGVDFDPFIFFDPRAIERRVHHSQDLYDSLDVPVSKTYLTAVGYLVDSMDVVSRWLNAVNVYANLQQIALLEQLPFIKRIEPENSLLLTANDLASTPFLSTITDEQIALVRFHTAHLKGKYFAENGYDGHGVRIAIFDTGFPGVDKHQAFKHIVNDKRIIATRDFCSKSANVFRRMEHGTMVMSLIGGMIDSIQMGLAPGAEFLLARTETRGEPFVEEKRWLAAAEWADQMGADIISSSLGYSYHRYFPDQMDGKTSLVAFAASVAVQKGILVVNAAGNDGNKESWKIISTPADANGILAVGALDYPSMLRASYSSRGSAEDGRVKPEVSALGTAYAAKLKGFALGNGSSFACPLVTGFAACVMQMHPEWTNIQIFEALQQSATLYPYFDFSHGYGIPQADYFFIEPVWKTQPTFDFVTTEDQVKVVIRHTDADVIERILNNRNIYYHIRDTRGKIEQYFVAIAGSKEVLSFDTKKFTAGKQVYVHFAGYTAYWTF